MEHSGAEGGMRMGSFRYSMPGYFMQLICANPSGTAAAPPLITKAAMHYSDLEGLGPYLALNRGI